MKKPEQWDFWNWHSQRKEKCPRSPMYKERLMEQQKSQDPSSPSSPTQKKVGIHSTTTSQQHDAKKTLKNLIPETIWSAHHILKTFFPYLKLRQQVGLASFFLPTEKRWEIVGNMSTPKCTRSKQLGAEITMFHGGHDGQWTHRGSGISLVDTYLEGKAK